MRFPSGLFYAVLFILVFFMLFKLGGSLTGSGDAVQQSLIDAYQVTEKMRNEANLDYQVQTSFDVFREQLYKNADEVIHDGMEPVFLHHLPFQALVVARTGVDGSLKKMVNIRGKTSEAFIKSFVELDYLVSKDQQEVFLNSIYAKRVTFADRELEAWLGIKADKISYMQLRASRLSMYDAHGRIYGLYWDSQTLPCGDKAYFFCRFDFSNLSELFPVRLFLANNQRPGVACGFFDLKRRVFIGNPEFKALQQKSAFSPIHGICVEIAENIGKMRQNVTLINSGGYLGVAGRQIMSHGLLPVAIMNPAYLTSSSGTKHGSLVFLIVICLGLNVFIQTFCFGRGLRLTVGRALILAILGAICMPFMMGQSVFRLILTEASESGRLKLERNLHDLISGVDLGARLFHANVLQNFKRLIVSDATIRDLEAEERVEKLWRQETTGQDVLEPGSDTGPEIQGDVVKKLALEGFKPFVRDLNMTVDVHRKANAIIVMGADFFTRYFDRFKDQTFLSSMLPQDDPIFMMLSLYRRTVEKFFKASDLIAGLAVKIKMGRAGDLEQFKLEETRRHVTASVGAEKVYAMLINFEGLNSFRTSIGLVHFAVFPVWINEVIQYFCGVSWDEFVTSRIYLARVFASYNRGKMDGKLKTGSVFDLIDPINYIAEPPAQIQAYGNLRSDMLYSGDGESARMGMLLKTGQRNRRIVKMQTAGADEALYYILPGRFFNLYVLGGLQPTAHLKLIEDWRALALLFGTMIFIACASLAAVNISRSVSSPLEHLLWGISRIEHSDFSVRLHDSREDEFGSISRAFNMMARRLRERDTLGKFVSPAVRRLAGNPELFKAALVGTEAEVTILFAALEGFDKFAASAPVSQVQARLEFTLEQFYRQAHEAGGEVDKVIGGKILIVFPHQQTGRHRAAMAAAGLAMEMIRAFAADEFFRPVFGINAGRVISGIIGASAVRMDNTVIGDPVNVAARLCSLADSKIMPIAVSEEIVSALEGRYSAARVDVKSIRGKKQEVEVFSLRC